MVCFFLAFSMPSLSRVFCVFERQTMPSAEGEEGTRDIAAYHLVLVTEMTAGYLTFVIKLLSPTTILRENVMAETGVF